MPTESSVDPWAQLRAIIQPVSSHAQSDEVTPLTADETSQFQQWVKDNNIRDVDHPDSYYDYRGYWKDVASKGDNETSTMSDGLHYPDTYKQHGHPTFSNESKYSTGPLDGGRWDDGDKFVFQASNAKDASGNAVVDDGWDALHKIATGLYPISSHSEAVARPPVMQAHGDTTPESVHVTDDIPLRPSRTGTMIHDVPAGKGILDAPILGWEQAKRGASELLTLAGLQEPEPRSPEVPKIPEMTRAKAAVSDVIEGAFQMGQPVVAAALLTNPVTTAIALGYTSAASVAAQHATRIAGGDEESQRLAGNIASLIAGGRGAKDVLDVVKIGHEAVATAAAEVGKTARATALATKLRMSPEAQEIFQKTASAGIHAPLEAIDEGVSTSHEMTNPGAKAQETLSEALRGSPAADLLRGEAGPAQTAEAPGETAGRVSEPDSWAALHAVASGSVPESSLAVRDQPDQWESLRSVASGEQSNKPAETTYYDHPLFKREGDEPSQAEIPTATTVYRGITADEAKSIADTGKIESSGRYSHSSEGTSFADTLAYAASAVNVGRDNPGLTQKPTYVVEVKRGDDIAVDPRDGWPKASGAIPANRIVRTLQFNPDGTIETYAGLPPVNRLTTTQTETPEFKDWFKGSAVVDTAGAPQVVYHGTKSNVDVLRPSTGGEFGPGIYVSRDPGAAAFFAGNAYGAGGENVMPLYVSLQHPFRVAKTDWIAMTTKSSPSTVQRRLIKQGYDGIIGIGLTGQEQIVAFKPEQVKSALGNRGTFDPTSGNILHEGAARYGSERGPRAGTGELQVGRGVRGGVESVAVDSRPEQGLRGLDLQGLPAVVQVNGQNRTASPADTEYAPQKAGLLPEWVSEEGRGDEPSHVAQQGAEYPRRPGTDIQASHELAHKALDDLINVSRTAMSTKPVQQKPIIHALGITPELIRQERIDLRGHVIENGVHDIASLMQAARDPRFETLRAIYVKDLIGGKQEILAHEALTSRLPDAAVSFIGTTEFNTLSRALTDKYGENTSQWPDNAITQYNQAGKAAQARFEIEQEDRMTRLGADGYYLVHNHPSGDPTPSRADLTLTMMRDTLVPGLRGHVVINHGEYAVIDNNGNVTKHGIATPTKHVLTPAVPHDVLGTTVNGPNDIRKIAQSLTDGPGVYLMYLTARNTVRAVESVPPDMLKNQEFKGFVRRRKALFGGSRVVAYIDRTQTEETADRAALFHRVGDLTDVVYAGKALSAQDVRPVAEPNRAYQGALRVEESPLTAYQGRSIVQAQERPMYERTLAEMLDRQLGPDDGFTYHLVTKDSPRTGFMVSTFEDRGVSLPADTFNESPAQHIAAFIDKNRAALEASGNYLGGWRNPEDETVYLDISTHTRSRSEAERLGRDHQQLRYFDLNLRISVEPPESERYGQEEAGVGDRGVEGPRAHD